MDSPLSIRLPADLRRELDRLSKRQRRPASDVAREALRRYLAVEQFRALRAKALPLAEAQGLLTDEDIFKAVSQERTVRVVLDTNVLLAALAARGLCDALVEACLQSHEVVLSEHILGELTERLVSELKLSPKQAREFGVFLRRQAEIVEPGPVEPDARRDPDDLPVLGTASAGDADVLVTGDRDLLVLGRYGGTLILTPREFYEKIKAG